MNGSLVIRKQKFKIKTNSEQLAWQLRMQLNDELQYNLLSVYEEVIHSLPNTKDNIFIDKISIDLGQCPKEGFRKKVITTFKEALIKELNDPADGGLVKEDFAAETNAKSNAHDQEAALFYFLRKGIYPWWFTGASVKSPQQLIAEMTDASLENLLVKIITSRKTQDIVNASRMIKRFSQQVSVKDQHKIITGLIALQSDPQLKRNLEMLNKNETINYFILLTGIAKETYHKILIEFLLKQEDTGPKDILRKFILFLYDKSGKRFNELLKSYKNLAFSKDNLAKLVKEIILEKQQEQSAELYKQKKKREGLNNKQPKEIDEPADEGIYINNAGLVILHPFLQPLFDNLGLLNSNSSFISEETRFRAAVVLFYLQNSIDPYSEYEMAFNKILCGIEMEEVLPPDIRLSDSEKKECNEMLQTVINFWEALKGSGKEALQEAFIRRSGKLNFKGDYWLLQVEKNAMDILVDRLPWGFGIIKLPWLQFLIHVEW